MKRIVRTAGLIVVVILVGLLELTPGGRLTAQSAVTIEPGAVHGLAWRNVGPNRGGRSIAVAGTASRPNEYYFGATGGGLWKSTNGGVTWFPVGDEYWKTSSVGAVGVCEANPDIVYVGFGEVQLRGDIISGDGVYRTTDGGKTWTPLGLASRTGQQMIGRIRVHPTNCDRAYVSALGDAYGPSEERGIFRTRDGGRTWEKVLYRDNKTGGLDLALDPGNPNVIYASMWEAYRREWTLSSGGEGCGMYKSTDGGDTWKELTRNPGLPKGLIGNIGLSVSGADSNRVYAGVEADDGGIFSSDDAGATWTRVSADRNFRMRPFYYNRLYADTQERDTLYVVNVQFWRSRDGGRTWKTITPPHGDNHDMWIDPKNNRRLIQSNDGGANVSLDAGETWTGTLYPTAQMYTVSTTSHFPYHICGGQQDNSTACVPSDGDGSWWYAPGGCESGWVAPHPRDPNVYYAGCYGGQLTMYDHSTGQRRSIQVWPFNPLGDAVRTLKERFQWTFPIVVSPQDPETVFVASQHVWRTSSRGQKWERISPDLTRNDMETMGPSGGPLTHDQTSVEYYGTVFSLAASRHDANTLWSGSDDGVVQVTRDGGKNWINVTPPDLPRFTRIHSLEVSPHDPAKAYVAATRYRMQDIGAYVYKTRDYGKSWTKIISGFKPGDFVRSVREDPVRAGLLFAGTETGPYVSFDDGASWQSLKLNLPAVSVQAVTVKDADLVIATHGRSFYVLDDISPLRQLSADVLAKSAHLFKPAPGMRSAGEVIGVADGRNFYRRTKEPTGLNVYYYLRQPARDVTLEFLDPSGSVIRSVRASAKDEGLVADTSTRQWGSTPATTGTLIRPTPVSTQRGLNVFRWDLRYPDIVTFPQMVLWAAGKQGPLVAPGAFRVRLSVDNQVVGTEEFQINKDPRLTQVTDADFDAQFKLALQIHERTNDAHRAIIRIRGIKGEAAKRLKDTTDRQIVSALQGVTEALSAVEEELYQVKLQVRQDPSNYGFKLNNKIAALLGQVESSDSRPTDQLYDTFTELSGQLDTQLRELERLLSRDVTEVNRLLQRRGLQPIQSPAPISEP